MHNVIVVTFQEPAKAYEALSVITDMHDEAVDLSEAAVVVRDADGTLRSPAGDQRWVGGRSVGGGLVGMLIGVLGGPIGVFIGAGTGVLLGAIGDADRTDRTDAGLIEVSRAIPPGRTALVCELEEYAVQPVDAAMGRLGGAVMRRPAIEVLEEFEDADAEATAEDDVHRHELHEQRKADRHERYEERRRALEARLGASA